jgi:hypothetical protein
VTAARRFDLLAALVVLTLAAATAALVLLARPVPLRLVLVAPADGAAGVPTLGQVVLTFSRPLDEASVRGGITIEPATDGFISAAGRRAAFTPQGGFRADTEYAVTVGAGLRDRAGRSLAAPVAVRFRTRGQALVVRTPDGRLLRTTLSGAAEPIAGPGVGEFATSAAGDLAYVSPGESALVVHPAGGGQARRVELPRALAARLQPSLSAPADVVPLHGLAVAPGGAVVGFLAPRRDGVLLPHLVFLDEALPRVDAFGLPPQVMGAHEVEARKQALLDTVYRRESFAFAPDGKGVIVRDRDWAFALVGLDGTKKAVFGAFLAVGNVSHRGDFVAFVDVDPADPALRRQVLAYERTGRLRTLSGRYHDSHAPRFANRSDRVVFAAGEVAGPPEQRRYGIQLVDLAAVAARRLTNPPWGQTDADPQWSPDDAWVSFRRAPVGAPEHGQVWLVPADGGPARPLPVPAVDARWAP